MPKALRLAFRVTFLVLLWKSGTKILFFQKPHTNFQRIISLKSTDISIILLRNTSFIFHENSLKLNIYLLYVSRIFLPAYPYTHRWGGRFSICNDCLQNTVFNQAECLADNGFSPRIMAWQQKRHSFIICYLADGIHSSSFLTPLFRKCTIISIYNGHCFLTANNFPSRKHP